MRHAGVRIGAVLLASLVGAAPALARSLSGGDPAGARPRAPFPAARGEHTRRASAMATIPAGSYLPLYGTMRVAVSGFRLDRHPVTLAEYAAFLRLHPEWRRSRAPRALAGSRYLASWRNDLDFGGPADGDRPVTEVSQAAAEAYCAAQGERLPTTDEWEYAAGASWYGHGAEADARFRQRVLELYTRPRPGRPAPVESTLRNSLGVWDLHGLVWEWTTAAAHAAMTHQNMQRGAHAGSAHDLGCAGSAAGASDTRDYASFLRYAFRSGLTPTSTLASLGFRCAR